MKIVEWDWFSHKEMRILEETVHEAIKKGWQPFGSITQAIVDGETYNR